jgi:hypothetical protein
VSILDNYIKKIMFFNSKVDDFYKNIFSVSVQRNINKFVVFHLYDESGNIINVNRSNEKYFREIHDFFSSISFDNQQGFSFTLKEKPVENTLEKDIETNKINTKSFELDEKSVVEKEVVIEKKKRGRKKKVVSD